MKREKERNRSNARLRVEAKDIEEWGCKDVPLTVVNSWIKAGKSNQILVDKLAEIGATLDKISSENDADTSKILSEIVDHQKRLAYLLAQISGFLILTLSGTANRLGSLGKELQGHISGDYQHYLDLLERIFPELESDFLVEKYLKGLK